MVLRDCLALLLALVQIGMCEVVRSYLWFVFPSKRGAPPKIGTDWLETANI